MLSWCKWLLVCKDFPRGIWGVTEVVPMMSKITDHKLNGLNYLDRSKMIRIFLRSIRMEGHLIKDPPTDDLR